MREREWCCEEYFAQVYGFEDMARDAGYESVQEFLQDARNSYDVTTMRAVRRFRREVRLFNERYEPPKDALRAKDLATMARRAARTHNNTIARTRGNHAALARELLSLVLWLLLAAAAALRWSMRSMQQAVTS